MPMSDEAKDLLARWPIGQGFSLPPESTIVVAGSYKGIVMEALAAFYAPKRIYGFDPQEWACDIAVERLTNAEKLGYIPPTDWQVFRYGIGVETAMLPMGEWETDAASFTNSKPGVRQPSPTPLPVRNWDLVMAELEVDHIDLFVCNMEGYELELLPYLLHYGWMKEIDNLAVQFHMGFGNDGDYENLLKRIGKTDHQVIRRWEPSWIVFDRPHA